MTKERHDRVQSNIDRLKNTSMGNFWLSVLYALKYKLDSMTIAEAERIIF